MNRKWAGFGRIACFPLIALVLFLLIAGENWAQITAPQGAVQTYIRSVQKGNWGLGSSVYTHNPISFAELEPGDILLGGYENCAYGQYSHAGLYLGNGEALEGYGDLGIHIRNVTHFRSYNRVAILRVQAEPGQKEQALAYARAQLGRTFYPLAFKNGERMWNCSKIMWKAYAEQGIDLDPNQELWIMPETLKLSPQVRVLQEIHA